MDRYRYCVIGAGIVGLSTAHHLLLAQPDASVVVLDGAPDVAVHQTGHNSGVIHSGIYYEPGSLKATLCKAGERETKDFCTEFGIAFEECGKLIVATNPVEVARLAGLQERAAVNGIGCRPVSRGELTELERATLVADNWASLLASRIEWTSFLDIARGLQDQDEPTPWTTVATAVDFVNRALTAEQRPAFAATVRDLFTPQFERLGWDARTGESELAPQLRSIVLGVLGTVGGVDEVRVEAARRFDANTLDGDLARMILRVVDNQNRPGDYETFTARYEGAANPQEEQRYMWGVADFADAEIAMDAAQRCFTVLRNQDAAIVLGLLSRNQTTGPMVWQYVSEHWDEALEKFPPSSYTRLTLGVPTFITDRDFADRVAAFHVSHDLGGEQRTVDQAIERMRVGLNFTDAIRRQF